MEHTREKAMVATKYLTFSNNKELEQRIARYFQNCGGTVLLDENNQPVCRKDGGFLYEVQPQPPTLTGLALALGFSSKEELLAYPCSGQRAWLIRRGLSQVEEYAERCLMDRGSSTGARFWLQNSFARWGEQAEGSAPPFSLELEVLGDEG